MSIPYIKKDDHGILTLYVDDKPFFCRSGEIHNSSASDPGFMDEKVWPALRGLHMNSVIAPVYWELLEPTMIFLLWIRLFGGPGKKDCVSSFCGSGYGKMPSPCMSPSG